MLEQGHGTRIDKLFYYGKFLFNNPKVEERIDIEHSHLFTLKNEKSINHIPLLES